MNQLHENYQRSTQSVSSDIGEREPSTRCERTPVRGGALKRDARKTDEPGRKRRTSARYIIGGDAMFDTGSLDSFGTLMNIGRHGILVRTRVQLPEGTKFWIRFSVEGYARVLQAEGQVVSSRQDLIAVKFVRDPTGLIELLLSLSETEYGVLEQLEKENARLKRLVAELSLEKQALQDVLQGLPI